MEPSNPKVHNVKQNLVLHKDSKSHEKFMWDIYVAVARQYSNNLSEETKKGLNEKAAQGWFPGNHKGGYKSIGDIGHRTWAIDDDNADHIYYHCSRKKDYDCKELYVSEETLTKSLFRFINFMYMAHPQVLNLTEDIRKGMEEYRKIRDQVLLHQDIDPDTKPMDLRDYARYALKDGTMDQKRQLIQLFNNQLYIHNKTIISKG